MVVHFNTSLKKLREEKRRKEESKTEVAELQDALIELAELVSRSIDDNSGGDNSG